MSNSKLIFTKCKRNSEIKRLKKIKFIKRRFLMLFFVVIFSFTSFMLMYKSYLYNKCKSLYYAVKYYLTNSNDDDKLLRVQSYTPTFSDGKRTVVKAYGLCKNPPHKKLNLECHFKKDKNNSWKLENIYVAEN